MGGTSITRLDGARYILHCLECVKDSYWYKQWQIYVRSVIHDVGTLESFERVCRSLAEQTNPGRLVMICVYAEELKKILPDQAEEIDVIRGACLQAGFMDMMHT